MEKGVRIISLEASYIYRSEKENGVEKGFILPPKKDRAYFYLFKNILDYSLDLIEMKRYYAENLGKSFSFYDDRGNEYTLGVINVKFTKSRYDGNKKITTKKLREHFYANGFNLGGAHYVRYKRSSGSSRSGKCLFINEKLLAYMEKWGECDLDKSKGDLASWEAYKSLSLSSLNGVVDIPLSGILFIADYKSTFRETAISVEQSGDTLVASEKETEIENTIWDGESLLDESLFSGAYADKHFLLLRHKFFKSCGFKTRLQKWFKDKNITLDELKDRGFITLATDISQIVMVTTPSSLKFLKFMGNEFNESNIFKWLDKIDSTFGVVKYDKRTKFFDGKMVQTSYQFINTLGLAKEQAQEFIAPSEEYIKLIRDDYDFMRYHFSDAYKREKNDETEGAGEGLAERSAVIFKLMGINYGFSDTKLYHNFRHDVTKDLKGRLKDGHILLSGTNATLFGNGAELLYALSGEFNLNDKNNEPMALCRGEIACWKFSSGETLVGARSPHITMGNFYCAVNNLDYGVWDYFDLGDNIVCVNAIGENIQQRLNGCDYDSDTMLITNDKLIVDSVKKQYDLFKVPVCKIKSSSKSVDLVTLDYETSENKIGEIVNLSQKINSALWDMEYYQSSNPSELAQTYRDICVLAVLSGIEIDKAKRAYDKVSVGSELTKLTEKYGKKRPEFFKRQDRVRIENQVKKVYDSDEEKRKEKKKQKREELLSKKEYAFYETTMEYVYALAGSISFQKGKKKFAVKNPIISMIEVPSRDETSTNNDYKVRDRIIALCQECDESVSGLKAQIEGADDGEKEVLYEQIRALKSECNDKVKAMVTSDYILYITLKKLDEDSKRSENWALYAPLLENERFIKMLKKSKEKMRQVYADELGGDYCAYGLKFSKHQI